MSEGAPCYATNPEGALHLEAKRLLRERLSQLARERQSLEVCYPCATCKHPVSVLTPPLQPEDVIKEEEWLDPLKTRKPDLTAWRAGEPIALYEIVATHPCGDEKWSELAARGLPVIEVLAAVVAGDGNRPAWFLGRPLPILRALGFELPSICSECKAQLHREQLQRAANAAEEEAERKRRFETRHEYFRHVWFVDLHFPDGQLKRRRMVLSTIEYRGQKEHQLLDTEGRLIKSWSPPAFLQPGILESADRYVRDLVGKAVPQALKSYPEYGFPLDPESVAEALRLEAPKPVLWWADSERRWVDCYSENFVRRRFPPAWKLRVWLWIKSGLIPILRVQSFAGARTARKAAERQLVDALSDFAYGRGPCPERLLSPPADVKRRMERIQEQYKRKRERNAVQQGAGPTLEETFSPDSRPTPQPSPETIVSMIWGRRK